MRVLFRNCIFFKALNSKRAFTLTELIIAIGLMGFVILTATAFQLMNHRTYLSVARTAEIKNEIATSLAYLINGSKVFATGNDGVGIIIDPDQLWTVDPGDNSLVRQWIKGRIDTDNDGLGDSWVGYRIDNYTLKSQIGAGLDSTWPACGGSNRCTILAEKIVGLRFEQSPPGSGFLYITLTSRFDPTRNESYMSNNCNPQLSISSSIYVPGMATQ